MSIYLDVDLIYVYVFMFPYICKKQYFNNFQPKLYCTHIMHSLVIMHNAMVKTNLERHLHLGNSNF